ncbi:MAG TPA: MerR family transcriptional regulator [Chryseobacterium sp.]|nr:MerR family transcriptional regulator [Chryseobacterium sp.]
MTEKISREELVRIYNVEITFFDSLEEAGLLSPVTENEQKYLLYEDLQAFERFTNWHYDLEVNLPGLEVIQHLLQKIEELRSDNLRLHRMMSTSKDVNF